MVDIDDDSAAYYAWFLNKRFNIVLNPPQRGTHVTFINDSMRDLKGGKLTDDEVNKRWEEVKKKWDGKIVKVVHTLEPRTDDNHWWLNIPHEDRDELHGIRAELGLGRPFWGLHMTIGIIHPHCLEHSAYIHKTLTEENVNEVSEHYAKILLNREIERKKKQRK